MIVWYGSFSRTVLNVFCKSFFTLVRWALFFMCSVFYVFLTFEFGVLFFMCSVAFLSLVFCALFSMCSVGLFDT